MNILGILRGFPGLGRVVSGIAILESLRDVYDYNIEIISYLQGKSFLENRGYKIPLEVTPLDYCSIGLVPTNRMGEYIHSRIKDFCPDIVLIDGEPLIVHSLRASYPKLKIVVLLNPSDIDNPKNNKEAMVFFNSMYSQADLAIVHGLREIPYNISYKSLLCTGTILRKEIFEIDNIPTNNIYCILGGGTVNVGNIFTDSTLKMAKLCIESANYLHDYYIHIVCSSKNIYDSLNHKVPENVILYKDIIDSKEYYSKACLVITRAGRNSLSELAYLGIPAVSFVSGCSYRKVEQEQNLSSISVPNICSTETCITPLQFAVLCKSQMEKRVKNPNFIEGNQMAINEILNLCNDSKP